MQLTKLSVSLFTIVVILNNMIRLEAAEDSTVPCSNGEQPVSTRYMVTLCLASGPLAIIFCPIGTIIAASLTGICTVNSSRSRRHIIENNCTYIESLQRSICLTPALIYKFGEAAYETCDWGKNGDQKCVGDEGYAMTCVLNQWKLTQICRQGARCKRYPGSARRVICE